jgi:hypothetical protein
VSPYETDAQIAHMLFKWPCRFWDHRGFGPVGYGCKKVCKKEPGELFSLTQSSKSYTKSYTKTVSANV